LKTGEVDSVSSGTHQAGAHQDGRAPGKHVVPSLWSSGVETRAADSMPCGLHLAPSAAAAWISRIHNGCRDIRLSVNPQNRFRGDWRGWALTKSLPKGENGAQRCLSSPFKSFAEAFSPLYHTASLRFAGRSAAASPRRTTWRAWGEAGLAAGAFSLVGTCSGEPTHRRAAPPDVGLRRRPPNEAEGRMHTTGHPPTWVLQTVISRRLIRGSYSDATELGDWPA
jgi:hypothetical protein